MCKDPVCGVTVIKLQARLQQLISEHAGKTYFFCSAECKRRFDDDPKRFIATAIADKAEGPGSEAYIG